jgi:PAS domain S-box-containing protein
VTADARARDEGRECAALIEAIDWRRTPMGAREAWASSLRTLVPIMLASRFAMRVFWGPEFVLLYNDAYRPILGPNKHPWAMGSRVVESFPEAWPVVETLFRRVYAGQSFFQEDFPLPLRRHGYLEESYFSLSYSPIYDDAGAVGGLLGIVSETTERVLAERRLTTLRKLATGAANAETPEQACRLAAEVLEASGADIPFALFYLLDSDGRTARLVKGLGLEKYESASSTLVDLEQSDAAWPLRQAARTRGPVTMSDLSGRLGELHAGPWPESVSTAVVLPLARPGPGHPQGFLIAGVSPRRALDERYRTFLELVAEQVVAAINHALAHVERRLRANEGERFRRLVEAVRDYAIFMLDPKGRISIWNTGAQAFYGYEANQVLGEHFSIFYPAHDKDAGKPEAELRGASSEGRFEDEGWRIRKDGSRFWANVVITPIRDAKGELTGFAKVSRDLTERRRVEEELRALVQRLGERTRELEYVNTELDGFSYSVSHDLRAPLRAIDGFARILLEDHAPRLDDEGKRVAEIICKNTQKMGQLIDDLLNFARFGRQPMRVAPLNMTALARKAGDEVLEPERSIDLRVADLPPVEGDVALIQQVWLNLLGNAVKYTRSRSPAIIEVTADVRGGEVVYSVRDNGVGFDQQYQNKLFGVFQRLHASSEFEGTGVGLALVQRIVRRHGGWVNAEGKLGEGATFWFALPKKDGASDGP